tara:strand:+ start:417 stop:608 length:192 start_codon:yes stop_codon:yes gene_type:complete
MYKMLFITNKPKPFKASWGAWFSCQSYLDGLISPLGWEEELAMKGIDFKIVNIKIEPTKEDSL